VDLNQDFDRMWTTSDTSTNTSTSTATLNLCPDSYLIAAGTDYSPLPSILASLITHTRHRALAHAADHDRTLLVMMLSS